MVDNRKHPIFKTEWQMVGKAHFREGMQNGRKVPILERGWQIALEVPFLSLAGSGSDPYVLDVSNKKPVWGKGEECTGCWWGNPRGRGRWGDPGVDGRIILGWTFRRWD